MRICIRRELRKHGVRLRLPRQSSQILKMLLERPGSLITREELRQALWPSDTFVDFDHSLNAAVNRLREVLGDSADEPRLVETLPRRGYRFIGEIALPTAAPERPGATQVSTFPGTSDVLPSADTRIRRSALRYSIMSFAVALLAGAVLFLIYGKLHRVAPHLSAPSRALPLIGDCNSVRLGRPTADCRLPRGPCRESRHLGSTGQRWRPRSDHQGPGTQLATGVVTRR